MFLKDILDTGAVTKKKLELIISNFCFRYYRPLPPTLGVTKSDFSSTAAPPQGSIFYCQHSHLKHHLPFLCLSRVQICTYLSLQSFGGNPNLGLWHHSNPEPTVLLGQTLQDHWHRTVKTKEKWKNQE